MPRVTGLNDLPGKLSIHVYADHIPPHFHVRSPGANAKIDIASLQVLRGKIDPSDYAASGYLGGSERQSAKTVGYWRRCNEPD